MAVRENPYPNYNFLVDLGAGDPGSVLAGFAEVILPDARVEVIEYRQGNEKASEVRKLPGRVMYGNLTLKRGVMGAADLYEWWDQVRNGDSNSFRTVTVQLVSEDNASVVIEWRFHNTWPVSYQFSGLNATGAEVLVENLELAFDRLDLSFDE